MKLLNLKIKNFRSFGEKHAEDEIRFKNGINLIVGENNVGKSNLLRALNVFKGHYEPTKNDYHAGDMGKEIVIELEVELSKKDFKAFLNRLTRKRFEDRKKLMRISKDFGRKLSFVYSSTKGLFFKIKQLYIKDNSAKLNADFTDSYSSVTWDKTLHQYFETGDFSIFQIVEKLTKGSKDRRISSSKSIDSHLTGLFRKKFKIFSEVRKRPRGENKTILESYDGSLVADVLATLKMGYSRQRKKFRLIKQKFTELFPNLQLEVTRKKVGQIPKIVVEKSSIDYEVPIDYVGAGIGEMIILLTHLIASKEMIFGLDMPELHLHPHGQRLLTGMLKKYAENSQILIVTHSPLFVEPEAIDNIIIVRQDQGETITTQLPEDYFDEEEKIKLQRRLDKFNREFFFSKACLLVEGETELAAMPIFSKAHKKDFDRCGVSLIKTGNHFGIFVKLLKGLEFPYVVMYDKDALMNIEGGINVNGQTIKTSPVFYNLLKKDFLHQQHVEKLLEFESKISSVDDKEKYRDELFKEASSLARTYEIYVLPADFEGVIRESGHKDLLEEAETISDSKVAHARFVAGRIVEGNLGVPKDFLNVIDIITAKTGVCENRTLQA